MNVTSPAFAAGGRIPKVYISTRGGGEDRSIPVSWSGEPSGTASYVVTVVDHAPIAKDFVHWVVVAIPSDVTSLPEGVSGKVPAGAKELKNTRGTVGYSGPMPPPGSGDHPYEVTVYALSVPDPGLPEQPSAADITKALQGKVLAQGSVTGVYSQ
jgi:Raf kinase inhibitor-like YbhB/YbcL family protein